MEKLFIEDIELNNKKVILRVDFNVPLKDGQVANDKRIRAALPTINYILEKNASLILMSHLGRPKGKIVPELSLRPVAKYLGTLINKNIKFIDDCSGEKVKKEISLLNPGEILVLENLRFKKEETENNPDFAKELASLADIYVNDAFGTAHRAHASTEGITKFIKTSACGYLLKKEIDYLGNALGNPKRPFTAIIGGAKISGKIDVIDSLLPKVDYLLIGGGMASTFFKAKGFETGRSLVEEDKVLLAKELLLKAENKIILPKDLVVTDVLDFDAGVIGRIKQVKNNEIPKEMIAVDIGPESIVEFSKIIKESKTIVWNGPMGVFEIEELSKGTFQVAGAMAEASAGGSITIIGGGDSASAIEQAGLSDKVSHVSTGGGASLEFLEGKSLPGLQALSDK
ncbi:MAG: phosphoglycerate kinase [Desulforegulaceae bacterium]|jgi:phosphoglycerate kinase|nr:phosphoglycerate kinase [Desulforegulaceae bacterium]